MFHVSAFTERVLSSFHRHGNAFVDDPAQQDACRSYKRDEARLRGETEADGDIMLPNTDRMAQEVVVRSADLMVTPHLGRLESVPMGARGPRGLCLVDVGVDTEV